MQSGKIYMPLGCGAYANRAQELTQAGYRQAGFFRELAWGRETHAFSA
jgi:hypothetical protein